MLLTIPKCIEKEITTERERMDSGFAKITHPLFNGGRFVGGLAPFTNTEEGTQPENESDVADEEDLPDEEFEEDDEEDDDDFDDSDLLDDDDGLWDDEEDDSDLEFPENDD